MMPPLSDWRRLSSVGMELPGQLKNTVSQFLGRCFEETFENTQWRKARQVQPIKISTELLLQRVDVIIYLVILNTTKIKEKCRHKSKCKTSSDGCSTTIMVLLVQGHDGMDLRVGWGVVYVVLIRKPKTKSQKHLGKNTDSNWCVFQTSKTKKKVLRKKIEWRLIQNSVVW